MKDRRQITAEPVFGTLALFLGLRKINTLGLEQADKVKHFSAIANNLKKYMKFIAKCSKNEAGQLALANLARNTLHKPFSGLLCHHKISFQFGT